MMTASTYDLATVYVLWRREWMRFLRQPARLAGALGQPILFWALIGSGFASTFHVPGVEVGYLEFFFPGVVIMVLLFASIFASVGVIEDRGQGFLQAILAGPGARAALVFGKCAGAATLALVQASLFLALAPLAGFEPWSVDWPLLFVTLCAASVGLTALGFSVAWILDSVQSYHAIQMTALMPMWMLSGAMFPSSGQHAAMAWAMALNPVAWSVSATRHALHGGEAPAALVLGGAPWLQAFGVCLFAAATVAAAVLVCTRRR